MLKTIANITLVENEKGEIGVGVNIDPTQSSLDKLKTMIDDISTDIKNMSLEDFITSISDMQKNREKAIRDMLSTINVDEVVTPLDEEDKILNKIRGIN